jgi:hypothetical protein
VADALEWRDALEISQNPSYLRPGQRVVAYPKILDKLSTVLQTGNVGHDRVDSGWLTYQRILSQIPTLALNSRPVIVREDDPQMSNLPDLAVKVVEWMEDAKRTAVGHFRQVLEDGAGFCSSNGDSEGADQDDSEPMGPVSQGRHQMTAEQVHAWHVSQNGESQPHSENQASAQSAFATGRASESTGFTTQAQKAAGSCQPATQPPTALRAPTPLTSDDDDDDMSEDQKRALASARRRSIKGRAGDLATATGTGLTGTRAARSLPPKTCAVIFPSEEGLQ